MTRRINILLFIFILLLNFFPANASTQLKIMVNNKIISSDVEPFIKNGTTYVPIRFISEALNISQIVWNEEAKTVLIIKDSTKISLIINRNYAYVNDIYTSLDANAILVNGRTFVPLRFISNCFDADVDWNQNTYTVSINTKTSNITSNNSYTQDEVYWLSRIIEAEASGEPLKGKVAVGEVILNRVESNDFPNTIWSVIFDTKFGVQFEPVANGSIYNTPSEASIEAAKIALNGSNYVGKSLYFLNPSIAESKWIINNREFYATIANHEFYL